MMFLFGLILGGCIGVFLTAFLTACSTPDDEEIDRWKEIERLLEEDDGSKD